MKKTTLLLSALGFTLLLSGCNQLQNKTTNTPEQTICFSQEDTHQKIMGSEFYVGRLGDDVTLNGGQCKGVKLTDMNKKGWRLVQVVSGMDQSFGMVFEK